MDVKYYNQLSHCPMAIMNVKEVTAEQSDNAWSTKLIIQNYPKCLVLTIAAYFALYNSHNNSFDLPCYKAHSMICIPK